MNNVTSNAISSKQKYWAAWVILLASAGAYALTMGMRQTMGLFLSPLNTATGLGIGSISLAFAFGQLWWGLTQPFAGIMADKVGAGRVLFAGVLLVALGTFITPFMTTTAGLILAIGVLGAGGAGMAGPAVLMAATMRLLPVHRHGMAIGIVNAGGSFGQFMMAPIAGALIIGYGWNNALQVMALIVLLALPAAYLLKGNSRQTLPAENRASQDSPAQPVPDTASAAQHPIIAHPVGTRAALASAIKNPSYLMLNTGFFVCGFHVAFLATHLPGVIASCGLPLQFGAWALAILGLFNIVGSLAMGWAVGHWRMKSLLSLVYATRAVAIVAFLLAPKTGTVALVFAGVMGLTFLSTVPPTAGLVAKFFGTTNMATLFGLVLLTHQVGAFLGVWLGGKVFEVTGNYDWLWYIDIMLAIGAALIHLPIREARLVRVVA